MQIEDKYELKLIFGKSSYNYGKSLSIDWIHNLVYFNEDKKINVFNMTDSRYGFVVTKEDDFIEIFLSILWIQSFFTVLVMRV